MQTTIDTPALLLVGGLGTRLRTVVSSTPKPLAPVGNKSFLELLVRQLKSQGIQRVVMSTGYQADQIQTEFGDGHDRGIDIKYSKEEQPLGTAGAVKLARHHFRHAGEFLVMNGDSFLEIDLHQLIRFHRGHGGLVSIAVVEVNDASRYGTVELDANQNVISFLEKTGNINPGLVNGGVYVFDLAILDHIPEGPASLEKDVFPQLLDKDVYASVQPGMFIDIGTPEDYARAQQLYESLYEAAGA
jgi:D-glycero-alpha-D-manno-heptose 1-phosphate guanylyltransferase